MSHLSVSTCVDRIESAVFRIEKIVLGILIVVMTCTTFVEVILRYGFNTSLIVGINELINWAFVWIVFIGMAMLIKTNEHIGITFFKDKFSKKVNLIVSTILSLALIAFSCIVIITSFPFLESQMAILTTSANIPKTYLYLATPVGMLLLIFHLVVKMIKSFSGGEC